MQHAEFRRLFGADPKRTEREVLAHRASCAECERYARDLERVDALVLLGAIKVPAPKPGPAPWELEAARAPARSPLRWYALAASLLVALAVGAGVWWNVQDRTKLIAEVVKHADKERNVMVVSEKRVDLTRLRRTLAASGATLLRDLPVSIARTCKVRGNPAPHLVLQTDAGAVAVLLMQKQRFFISHDFAAQGYEGTIVPMGRNSIAVLGTNKDAVKLGTELVEKGIDWPGVPLELMLPAPQNGTDGPSKNPAPPPAEKSTR